MPLNWSSSSVYNFIAACRRGSSTATITIVMATVPPRELVRAPPQHLGHAIAPAPAHVPAVSARTRPTLQATVEYDPRSPRSTLPRPHNWVSEDFVTGPCSPTHTRGPSMAAIQGNIFTTELIGEYEFHCTHSNKNVFNPPTMI